MAKYTNAHYPDKINDLVDNDGNVNIPSEAPFEWHTTMLEPISDTQIPLYLSDDDFIEIATSQPLKVKCDIEDQIQIDLIYKELINGGVRYNGHVEGVIIYVDMSTEHGSPVALLTINPGDQPGPEPSDDNDYAGFAAAVQECYEHRKDTAYSNTWTFSFHNADTRELELALLDLGTFNAYEALIRRATLAVNVTGTNMNQEDEEDGISFGVVKPFFRIWLQSSGDENVQQMEFGYTTFSGTITLFYSDDQE